MPPPFPLRVVTPDHVAFEGRTQSLVAPGREGYFGVLFGHAPMVAELATGELKLIGEKSETQFFALSGGFLEVAPLGEVAVLADSAEAAAQIDVARARAAQARAEGRLADYRAADRLARKRTEVDFARAEAALRRALNRLRVAGKAR